MAIDSDLLADLIKPLRTAKWQADFSWHRLQGSLQDMTLDAGDLDLNPDFQRGHVWTHGQRQHFIENCLRGVVSSSGLVLQFNCPDWNEDAPDTDLPAGMQCIDGLQRYTAITEFVNGNVHPFGVSVSDLQGTQFDPRRFMIKVAVHDFKKRADLLQHYLDINTGGTVHAASEIERVKGLLAQANRGD